MNKTKLITAVLLVVTLMLSITACGNATNQDTSVNETSRSSEADSAQSVDNDNGQSSQDADTEQADTNTEAAEADNASSDQTSEPASDILVVYFSRTGEQYGVGVIDEGNTAIVAKMIAENTGADTFEILPTDDHYPMTYDELTDVAKREQNENARPSYAGEVPDLSQYSTIFIGAPVWWGDWPMICYTFFENEDLSGKTLYPFSTHAGSGLSGFDRKLSSAVPDATVGEGLAIAGTDCQNNKDSVRSKVNDWLSGLG